jgi:hypothetical protein
MRMILTPIDKTVASIRLEVVEGGLRSGISALESHTREPLFRRI